MTFANNLDPDEAPQNVGLHLRSKLFDIQITYQQIKWVETMNFLKLLKETNIWKNYPACKELKANLRGVRCSRSEVAVPMPFQGGPDTRVQCWVHSLGPCQTPQLVRTRHSRLTPNLLFVPYKQKNSSKHQTLILACHSSKCVASWDTHTVELRLFKD